MIINKERLTGYLKETNNTLERHILLEQDIAVICKEQF